MPEWLAVTLGVLAGFCDPLRRCLLFLPGGRSFRKRIARTSTSAIR